MGLMGLYHDISLLNWDLQTHVQLEAIHHSATLSSCAAPCLRPLRRTGMGSCSPRCDTTHLWSNCGRFMALLYSHKKRFVEKGYPKSEQSELLKKLRKRPVSIPRFVAPKRSKGAMLQGEGWVAHLMVILDGMIHFFLIIMGPSIPK